MLTTSAIFGLDDNTPAVDVEASTLSITPEGLVFIGGDFLVSDTLVHVKSQRQVTQLEQRETAAKRKAFPWRF
ncbi:hypothetical protein LCGC14_1948760 [marine sediment metagenome]|uniref:Uncharacterized protein n=1 Tax=marine sediment metagenome TaxID=412755 RepID=A0A0F9HWE8_9ZZZZ